MNTQKLYFSDSYKTEFSANIIEVQPFEGKFAILLDQSYFYPESGGQPADTGWINDSKITYVSEKQGKILHISEKAPVAGPARCSIDWNNRFDNMQQHSGQHILSSCFYKLYEGETSSFHIGSDSSTIEIDVQSFDADRCEEVEALANSLVFQNLSINAEIVDKAALAAFPLRKQPQVDSNIRIVSIENCDCTPCGGTHVKSTGEIGLIKIKKLEKLKSSYKFEFVCGSRALKDYSRKNAVINKLGTALSAPEQQVENAFYKFIEDFKGLQKQLSQLRSQVIGYETKELLESAEAIKDMKVIYKIFDDKDFNNLKLMAQSLVSTPSTIALLALRGQNNQLIFTRAEDLSVDMNSLLKSILPVLNGRGGGSPKAAQGGGSGNIEEAMKLALENIRL